MELWRDAPGYEGYQVSNEGNVKSLKFGKEKLLKPGVNGGRYLQVRLYKDGNNEYKRIHQLVAQAFIPNPLGYTEVNHKDEDKTNNRVENLEWCDSKYNSNYGTRNQRIAEGQTNGKGSKPVYQYTLDGRLVKIWPSVNECGRNGFSVGNISDCCNNKYLREGNNIYKGFRWSYVPL